MSNSFAFPFDNESVAQVAIPADEQVEYRDEHPDAPPGFRLRVSYGGRKTFYVILRVGNRKQRKKVGSASDLSVAEARAAAREVRAKILENKDPAVAEARTPPSWNHKVKNVANDAVVCSTKAVEAGEKAPGTAFFRSPEDIDELIRNIPAEACPEALRELHEMKRILEMARERFQMRLHRLLPVAEAVASNHALEDALMSYKAKYYASGKKN